MKKISQAQQNEFSRYLDGLMTPAEQLEFESILAEDKLLKARFDELRFVQQSLLGLRPEQPSRNFTSRVMQRLNEYPAKSSGLSMRSGIFLLIGVLLAVGIGSVLISAGVFDSATTTLGLPHYAVIERLMKRSTPGIPFNGKLVVNIIILLNLGLAWLVLDKAILKPLFQRRMEAGE